MNTIITVVGQTVETLSLTAGLFAGITAPAICFMTGTRLGLSLFEDSNKTNKN